MDGNINSELQRKLAELNTQVMNYRMGIGANPLMATSYTPPVIDVTPTQVPEQKQEVQEVLKPVRGARGKRGKRGPKGEQGIAGEPGKDGIDGKDGLNTMHYFNAKVVSENYMISVEDSYIGIRPHDQATLVLPEKVEDGKILTFKLEIAEPVENRKAVIRAFGGAMIDGDFLTEIRDPYETLSLIYRGGDWYVLNRYKG